MTDEIRDAAGRIMTREHPEDVLLKKLEECESLRDVLEFCIWVLDELGYKRLAKASRRRLEQALEEAAEIEQAAEEELGKPNGEKDD
jgi:hypothetical protein